MTKYLLTTAAAIALFTGGAMAQISSETSTTTRSVTVPTPMVNTYSSTETKKTSDDGVTMEKSKSYSRDASGVSSKSSVEVNGPDGSKSESHERKVSPDGSTVVRSKSEVKIGE